MIYYILSEILALYIFICGICMKFFPEGGLVKVFGYMGKIVPKDEEMKKHSYKLCGGLWTVYGILFILFSFLLMRFVPLHKSIILAIVLILQFSFMVFTVVKVEIYFIKKYKRG